jgi:hypothetical protein
VRLEKTVDLGHMQVRVTEITVGALRNLISQDIPGFNAMDWIAGRSALPADLISAFTDLSSDALQSMTFSEIQAIIEVVQEVNGSFFFVLEKLGLLAGLIEGMRDVGSSESAPT